MATMKYTRELTCINYKYYFPATKPFSKSIVINKEKPTYRKCLVCKDWKYKYE